MNWSTAIFSEEPNDVGGSNTFPVEAFADFVHYEQLSGLIRGGAVFAEDFECRTAKCLLNILGRV
ncbi:hypothetical protein [Rhodopirellula bahusiensis]|uniref:hypothetical protein n=1 Tax=Rhodopirellula bahusiensis TaxID=2014065 RepID=UPI00326433F6